MARGVFTGGLAQCATVTRLRSIRARSVKAIENGATRKHVERWLMSGTKQLGMNGGGTGLDMEDMPMISPSTEEQWKGYYMRQMEARPEVRRSSDAISI